MLPNRFAKLELHPHHHAPSRRDRRSANRAGHGVKT
jgi:hypothetical protein